MTRNVLLLAAIQVFCCSGCVVTEEGQQGWLDGPRLTTVSVYDNTVPWPSSGVYAWHQKSTAPSDIGLPDLDVHAMIRSALATVFGVRGFELGTPPAIDFYVAYRLIGNDPLDDAALDAEYPVSDRGRWLPSRRSPQEYAPGSLVVDIVCVTDNCPRWRGSVSSGIYLEGSAEEHQEWLDQAAHLLLRTFPPPGAVFGR